MTVKHKLEAIEIVRCWHNEQNATAKEIGAKLGVVDNCIYTWVNGKSMPTHKTADKIHAIGKQFHKLDDRDPSMLVKQQACELAAKWLAEGVEPQEIERRGGCKPNGLVAHRWAQKAQLPTVETATKILRYTGASKPVLECADYAERILSVLERIETAALFSGSNSTVTATLNSLIGKKVIIRTYTAGVHFGELSEKNGDEVILKNSRRLWWWKTANKGISLSEVANEGLHQDSKVCAVVENIWLKAIEIIPCTEIATKNIEGQNVYQA